MDDIKAEIRKALKTLLDQQEKILGLCRDAKDAIEFGSEYQHWYTRAIKVVKALAPDRFQEFRSYYEIDRKRKMIDITTYVIQDYVMGLGPRFDRFKNTPLWDANNLISIRFMNQMQILVSLESRIEGVLSDVEGHLFADLQDAELQAANELKKVNLRAAGAVAGVVLERHLQRVADNHTIKIKKNPTLGDLNDPLRAAGIYDTPMWRKIQLFADIRNICTHNKDTEPTTGQVEELISGVNSIIKTTF